MKLLTSVLLALPLAFASPVTKRDTGSKDAEGDTPFVGTGKLGMYHDATGTYMGCSTADGLWTVDESQCATFTGTTVTEGTITYYQISTDVGLCGTSVDFSCGVDESTSFYVSPLLGFTRCYKEPSEIEEVKSWSRHSELIVLQILDFGFGSRLVVGDLYRSYSGGKEVYPEGSKSVPIHLWGSTDSGKFVQLGWNATNS
jgi:hypothetical protein